MENTISCLAVFFLFGIDLINWLYDIGNSHQIHPMRDFMRSFIIEYDYKDCSVQVCTLHLHQVVPHKIPQQRALPRPQQAYRGKSIEKIWRKKINRSRKIFVFWCESYAYNSVEKVRSLSFYFIQGYWQVN